MLNNRVFLSAASAVGGSGALASSDGQSGSVAEKPHPDDLCTFLPWACTQFQVCRKVAVKKIVQVEPRRREKSKSESLSNIRDDVKNASSKEMVVFENDSINVLAIYHSNQLVSLKFVNTVRIPRELIKVLALIVECHKHLTHLSFSSGVDSTVCHELAVLLPLSNITDLGLDGCFVREGVYYLFLEQVSKLKNLSLARCNINDAVIKLIALKLTFPEQGSKTLCLLDLSSNSITDDGGKYLATMLRTNRTLCFLNISNNRITDVGAESILSSLQRFALNNDEIDKMKLRYANYFKRLNEMTQNIANSIKTEQNIEVKDKIDKLKNLSLTPKEVKIQSMLHLIHSRRVKRSGGVQEQPSDQSLDNTYLEKAFERARLAVGEFQDPFDKNHRTTVDGKFYCEGNNRLAYLNLSYNYLSEFTLLTVVDVLEYQAQSARVPRGLVKICVEGNPLPLHSENYFKINKMLGLTELTHRRRRSSMRSAYRSHSVLISDS